jgi:hypothetical protein
MFINSGLLSPGFSLRVPLKITSHDKNLTIDFDYCKLLLTFEITEGSYETKGFIRGN